MTPQDDASTLKFTKQWLSQKTKQCKIPLSLTILFSLIQSIATIMMLGSIAYIIYAAFILRIAPSALYREFVLLMAMILLRAVAAWLKEISAFKMGAMVRASIRKQLLSHLERLTPLQIHGAGSGVLSTTVLELVEVLQDYYAYYVPQIFMVAFIPIIILSIVFSINWLSGLILLACGPLIPFFMALVGMGASSANRKHFQALERMSGHFLDVLQGLKTLKLFGRSHEQAKKIEKISDEYRKKTMSVLRIAFLSSGVLEFFSAASIALVAVCLGLTLLGHIYIGYYAPMTLFGALFILLLAPEFFLPLRELGAHYHARAQAIGAAEGVLKVLAIKPETKTSVANYQLMPPISIEFDRVNFAYPSAEKKIFQNLSFSVKPNEHIYIISPSGEGKTTLLNLLMGFLKADAGQIKMNGIEQSEVARHHWLKQISWIGQHPKLFHGTLRDNLLLAKPDATESELQQAMEAANIDSFVKTLPQGLNTEIGEQNIGLSGGQAQRIALARAFLKDAPVLLLDEPTANLDSETEAQILFALKRLAKNKTAITLTHRLEQLPGNAKIFELKSGALKNKYYDDETETHA